MVGTGGTVVEGVGVVVVVGGGVGFGVVVVVALVVVDCADFVVVLGVVIVAGSAAKHITKPATKNNVITRPENVILQSGENQNSNIKRETSH